MGEAMMGLGAEAEGVFLFPTLLHTLVLINSPLLVVRDRKGVESLSGLWLTPDTHQELLKAAGLGLKFYSAAQGAEKLLQTLLCPKKNQ